MLAFLCLGLMRRSAAHYRRDCTVCGIEIALKDTDLPAALTLQECSDLSQCPHCLGSNRKQAGTIVIQTVAIASEFLESDPSRAMRPVGADRSGG